MYFYTKLITVFNYNLNFNNLHAYIRRNPEKEKKKIFNSETE